MSDAAIPVPVVPSDDFAVEAPDVKSLMLGSGPRLARDAFGPMLGFYAGWRLGGLVAGILVSTVVSMAAYWYERHHDRPGLMARISLGIVLVQTLVGLASGSERVYLAQPVLVNAAYGLAFIGSVFVGRPLTGAFAEEMYTFPDEVRRSTTFRSAFGRISLVWGAYLLARSALRLVTLSSASVEAFLAVNFLTGLPLTALLMAWSVWYAVRFFRRSEEWGPALRALDELAAAGVGVPVQTSPVAS